MATANDSTVLQVVGTKLLGWFYLLVPVTILEGIFLLLFAASTFTVYKRGLKTISSWIIFLGMLLNFGLGTAQWAGLVAGAILETRILLVEHPDLSLEAKIGIYEQAVMKIQVPLAILEAVPLIISDAIVIWRAWSLFPTQRWVMAVPSVLLLGSLGTWIAVAVNARSTSIAVTDNGFLAYLSLSLVANVITTLLIGWKLWKYRQFLICDLGLTPRRSPVLQILITVVESGLIFALLQFGFLFLQSPAVLNATTKPSEINAENVLNVAFLMLSAFYPSIVALAVNIQGSYIGTVDFGSENLTAHQYDDRRLTNLSFAVPALSPTNSRRTQSSTINWTQKRMDSIPEGSDTLEMLERDSNVFENKGMRHISSAP